MSRTLIIGTSNPGKRREMQSLLEGTNVLLNFSDGPSPDETGTTFFENALIKARATAAYESAKFPSTTLYAGEDSGICVPALGGAPGVFSARYSLLPAQRGFVDTLDASLSVDDANNLCLLEALSRHGAAARTAFYESRLVVVDSSGEVIVVTSGRAHGTILDVQRGSEGFGYDPMFLDAQGDCWGVLDPVEKNRRSHRAKAFHALIAVLSCLD